MAGTLFVVATPIGHLEDISARALRTLREVALVAAEDTRRTGQLLRHFGITTRQVSLHQHNERRRTQEVLDRLERGDSVALVSDAGTPGIADPGAELVRLARARSVRVEPIPGPSAISTALSISGLHDTEFVFMGFPPIRSKDRKKWFARLGERHATLAIIAFEAPHRIVQTINEIANYVKSPILVMRELTKRYEEVLEGMPGDVVKRLTAPQGEFTLVIPPQAVPQGERADTTDAEIRALFGQMIESDWPSRRELARHVATRLGETTRRVYEVTKDMPFAVRPLENPR